MRHSASLPGAPVARTAGLWLCRACFAVQLVSPTPRSWEPDDESLTETEDEGVVFLRTHAGHPLTPLKKKKDRYYADRPVWDPLRVAYEEVSDGRETYLLKSWRTDLNAPRQYALLRGALQVSHSVQLADEPLREELIRALTCSVQQAERLISRLQRVVASLAPEELLPAYCAADDPQVLFSYLNERQLRVCVEACQTEPGAFDKTRLRNFFLQHQQEDALTLEVRHAYQPHFS